MQEHEVEEAVELVSHFAQMADALESEAFEKAQRRLVFGVDPRDHNVLAEREGNGEDSLQQIGPDALSARIEMNVNGAFDRESIARPCAKICEGCKPRNVSAIGRDEHGEALRSAAASPRDPFLNGCRTVVVYRRGMGENLVINRRDLFEVGLDCVADLHVHLRCRRLSSLATCRIIARHAENEGSRPMSDTDRHEILRVFEQGADALAEALKDMDEVGAGTRPRPESWSALECVEHLTLTETALLSRLREAKPSGSSHEDRAREAKFQDLALNRSRRIEAPEPVVPKSHAKDLAQALEDFNASRKETVRFVEEFPGDLRWWLTTHPLITRPVNCYEMLLLIAMHPRRHARQIEDTRALLVNLDQQR